MKKASTPLIAIALAALMTAPGALAGPYAGTSEHVGSGAPTGTATIYGLGAPLQTDNVPVSVSFKHQHSWTCDGTGVFHAEAKFTGPIEGAGSYANGRYTATWTYLGLWWLGEWSAGSDAPRDGDGKNIDASVSGEAIGIAVAATAAAFVDSTMPGYNLEDAIPLLTMSWSGEGLGNAQRRDVEVGCDIT